MLPPPSTSAICVPPAAHSATSVATGRGCRGIDTAIGIAEQRLAAQLDQDASMRTASLTLGGLPSAL
jgi:hypothetical protein